MTAHKQGVRPWDYAPPAGDRYLYVAVGTEQDARMRKYLSIGATSDARLAWLARVVLAEIQRRQAQA